MERSLSPPPLSITRFVSRPCLGEGGESRTFGLMESATTPIESLSVHDLIREWTSELGALQSMESSNPSWEWKAVQPHLERLHALAQELRRKKGLERAKWQP